ncbi:hypothetical protein scyTo_0004771 [Scyliorhinus torazame]|uniref:Uncharacterized protein n=1 Tax=Scyliorhinus torazame TaxID=75743 RepID=A0A401NWX6_SCYTO|nr:hypothetical protein [Scyliorhinus torazame]
MSSQSKIFRLVSRSFKVIGRDDIKRYYLCYSSGDKKTIEVILLSIMAMGTACDRPLQTLSGGEKKPNFSRISSER